jgi:tripartite-type tricarboxylate transporter receptor subunit TctC
MVMFHRLRSILILLFILPLGSHAEYPEKPIDVILPWPPAASTDVSTRLVLEIMSEKLGVPMKVINKPGGRGVIGTTELTQSRPDGYTLGAVTVGPAVTQIAAGNAPYQMDALDPIGLFATLPFVLLARADAPFDDLQSLARYTESRDEPWVLGHWGRAAVPTLTIYRIAGAEGYEFKEIAFQDLSASQLLNGDADLVTVSTPAVMGQIQAGTVKPIAAMTPVRNVALPDLRTVREQGYGFDAAIWAGLFAPAGTPDEIIATLASALEAAVEDPRMDDFILESGAVIFFQGPAATREQMQDEFRAYSEVMQGLGLIP